MLPTIQKPVTPTMRENAERKTSDVESAESIPSNQPSTPETPAEDLRRDPRARLMARDKYGREKWAKPNPGFDWNPLLDLPANRACPCMSGEKFKKCCRPKLPPVVPAKVAELYREQMSRKNLVFVTKGNEAILKAQIPQLEIPDAAPVKKPEQHAEGNPAQAD